MILQTENKLYHLFRAMRPRQWIKNLAVFAPIVFTGNLFNPEYFFKEVLAFIYFSGVSSAIYLINDTIDEKKDRLHPIKKNRPIASGALSKSWAILTAIALIVVLIPSSFIIVGTYFGVVLLTYFTLMLAYNFKLKNIIIIDALTIAMGFILRVFGGALAIPLAISSWLVLAVTGVSLLIAFGKRRAERTLLEAKGVSKDSTRKILQEYPDSLLDSMISMSAAFAIISYSLFTFQVSPQDILSNTYLFELFLPSTLIGAKLLMLTIPVVIYSVARYLYVIYEKSEGESPERVLLNDKPLLFSAILWGIMVVLIVN